MRKLSTAIVGAVLLLLLSGACYEEHFDRHQTVQKAWPAAEVSAVSLKSVNGTIEIRAIEGDQLSLHAEIESSNENDRDPLRFDLSGGTLSIRENWEQRRGIFPFFHAALGKVRYELNVPAGTELEITNTNGRLVSTGVRGEQSLRSVNGRIEVITPDSKVTATTVNGRITLDVTEQFRGARLRTVNGSVRITVPKGSSIAANVDQVNGSFNSSLPVIVNGGVGGDRIPLEVTTVNGSVTLGESAIEQADGESR